MITGCRKREPYPPVGAILSLWHEPDTWAADVRVLARVDKGDVMVRVIDSAQITKGWNVRAKILRSGRWTFRAIGGRSGRSGAKGFVRAAAAGVPRTTGLLADDLDAEHRSSPEPLPRYFGNDETGRAMIALPKNGGRLRRERRNRDRKPQ